MVPAGQGISFREAKALLRHYLDCILQFRKQLEALLRRQPELRLNTWVDDMSDTDPNIGQAIASELNNRYEIYIRLRDELERVKASIVMRERAAALAASLQRTVPATAEIYTKRGLSVKKAVQELLESLEPGTPPESQVEIEALAQTCLAAKDLGHAELLLTDLRVRVHRLNRVIREKQRSLAKRRDKEAVEARDLMQRLGALGQDPEGVLHDDLLRVASGEAPLTETLRTKAATALAKADRDYAGTVLKETLEQLGYEVQESFETLFAQGGSNFFQRPSWGKYHCRISVDSERERLNFDMVRYGEGREMESIDAALRDKEMEEQWCQEVPGLLNQLAQKRLAIDLTRKLAPGTIALQVIDDVRLKPRIRQQKRDTSAALVCHLRHNHD